MVKLKLSHTASVRFYIQKPTEEQIVMADFDQQRFGADREEGREEFGFAQAFGWDRGPAQFGIHPVEFRGELLEGLVG